MNDIQASRKILAEQLRAEVLPQELAEQRAKQYTTAELANALCSTDLTVIESRAYEKEAELRLSAARSARGGH